METSVAKRPRLRLEPQNDEEIIQQQKQVIKNLKARNLQLEEQLKNSESAMETKIKNVPVPELPNKTWLEIMS